MDKIQEITQKMRNVIKDHPLGFLTIGVNEKDTLERVETPYVDRWGDPQIEVRYKYVDAASTINSNGTAFNGNRGALVVAAGFAFVILIAVVAAVL